MQLVPLTAQSPAELLDGWADVYAEVTHEEFPELDPPDRRESVAELAEDAEAAVIALLALDDGRAVGGAVAHLELLEDLDRASVELIVSAPARRRGVARRLADALAAQLLAAGRTRVGTDVRTGGPGESFAVALGGRVTQVDVQSRLDLDGTDAAELRTLVAGVDSAYRLVQWDGRCPDDLVDAFAAVRTAMNDAPRGSAEREPLRWDTARVRRWEERSRRKGMRSLTTAAVHERSGEVAGFTEIQVPGAHVAGRTPTGVWQEDTAVIAGHRGHGLGLVIKAANLLRLQAEHPGVGCVITWNAESNRHMRQVNERLGFQVSHRWSEVELALPLDARAD